MKDSRRDFIRKAAAGTVSKNKSKSLLELISEKLG